MGGSSSESLMSWDQAVRWVCGQLKAQLGLPLVWAGVSSFLVVGWSISSSGHTGLLECLHEEQLVPRVSDGGWG